MSEDLLIIVALMAAGSAFVGILIFFSCRLRKTVAAFTNSENERSEKVLVVNRSKTVSNVNTIEFD